MTTSTPSKARLWLSYVMSGLVILFMLFDSIMKFVQPPEVIDGTLALGFAAHHLTTLGALGLVCTILYAIPRTSILGAILFTGYIGGTMATHIRLDNPLFTHILFGTYLAILAWAGLWLRNEKVRNLF